MSYNRARLLNFADSAIRDVRLERFHVGRRSKAIRRIGENKATKKLRSHCSEFVVCREKRDISLGREDKFYIHRAIYFCIKSLHGQIIAVGESNMVCGYCTSSLVRDLPRSVLPFVLCTVG